MSNTIKIECGGETRYANNDTWTAVADELVKKYPGQKPQFTFLPAMPTHRAGPTVRPVVPVQQLVANNVDTVDGKGEKRSLIDLAGAKAGGFSPEQPVYRRGRPVNSTGVANAHAFRMEHDKLPSVEEACNGLKECISKENRQDLIVRAFNLRMDNSGRLAVSTGKQNNYNRCHISKDGFSILVNRMGIGGGDYLSKCWSGLRAVNFNNWASVLGNEEAERMKSARSEWLAGPKTTQPPSEKDLKLRTRLVGNTSNREVFGVVTPSYTSFDTDKIAQAVALAMPPEAKAEIVYDGLHSIIDVRFHSDVKPENYVAGEFFKAGIRIKSSDIGDGSIWINSTVFQNLCLNLIIIDKQTQGIARQRHIGSIELLVKKFKEALQTAKDSLKHFLDAWNYSSEQKVTAESIDRIDGDDDKPITMEQLIPGIFNGLKERELITIRRNEIPKLVLAHQQDTSYAAKQYGVTKTTIANAITRYAHEYQDDHYAEDDLERAAGQLIWQKKPLPFARLED